MPLFLIASRLLRSVNRYRVAALLVLALVTLLIGAALFSVTQHVGLGIAIYWAVTTATTVGYGDVTPHNTAGRIVAIAVMLTTIPILGAVFALVAGAAVINRIRRLLGMDIPPPHESFTAVYGLHPIVPRVLEELHRAGDPVLLVAPSKPPGISEHVHFLAGDPTDEAVIRRSEPARANRALIATTSDADTLVIAVAIHSLAPSLEVFALAQSPSVARALTELGVTHTLASDELVGHTLAKSLETRSAGDLLLSLVDAERYRLGESPVPAELVAKPLSQARASAGRLVLGIARGNRVDLGVGDDPVLGPDDRLVVLEPL
jgi:voltage-gated potassium channel